MSLFDKLFGNSLESSIAEEFAVYKNKIDQIIARENDILRGLGIPIPRLTSEINYNQTAERDRKLMVTLVPPQFEFPPHRQFFIRQKLVITLFENLEEAEGIYRWWGLGQLVYDQSNYLVWTNRAPYELYEELQKKPTRSVYCAQTGDFTRAAQNKESYYLSDTFPHISAERLPALVPEPDISIEEASDIHLRVQLYNYMTGGEFGPLRNPTNYYNSFYAATAHIPDDILSGLPVPQTWLPEIAYSSIKILPSGEIRPAQMIEFLGSLHAVNFFFSFEFIRNGEIVYFQLRFPTECESVIFSKLNLYFPDFEILENYADEPPIPHKINWLQKQSMYKSIRRVREFQLDPYAHFASLFENAAPGDLVSYQIMFAPLLDESAAILKRYLADAPSYVPDFYDYFVKRLPLWFVGIALSSTNEMVADNLSNTVAATFNTPNQNFDEPISYIIKNSAFPLLFPLFLSLCDTDELAALVHFPITELPIERLERVSMKNVQPPQLYTTGNLRIGWSRGRGGQMQPVALPDEVRDRHVYIVGKSGTGKSTVMEAIARRDIESGGGVAVIDPHGDLVQHLLETMPEHRVADCVLFSPKRCPISLEILAAENEHEIDLLSDDLITMFRRTSESWGDKMQAILQMAFQTLLRVPGSSFTDITTLLTDENYRRRILDKINHPQLASFWEQRYDARQAEPILIRMDRLTTSGTLRRVLTQDANSLNFYDVITESRIFLADLSKGFLGESTSHLLGSIIVSQIQLAAMRQAQLPSEQRIPFSLFVDEVQNFTTSAFSTILSEARKQKLRLCIAHQFVSQLPQEIQKAIFGNVGTMLFFALSPDDLGAARHELGTFEAADVANLPKYHALCRPATAARDTFSFATDPPPALPERDYTQEIIEQTAREYGAPLAANEQSPPPQPSANIQPSPASEPPTNAPPELIQRRPAAARALNFATNTEKILHFIRQAEYLSQPQIIALTGLQASNASTALKRLVETGMIKTLDDRRPKIYFVGRGCSPTTHNLLVRDLFVKISASNYAVRKVLFNDQLADLNPDLTVEFIGEDGTPLLAYFELDRGTEGVQELVRKAERYARISPVPPIGFVFERESDLQSAQKNIPYSFISYATLDGISSLEDAAFRAGSESPPNDVQLPFFR
jgi:hypothetical protein